MRRALIGAVLVACLFVPLAGGTGSPRTAPPPAAAVHLGMASAVVPAAVPPPPPYDWDPMWFNATSPVGVAGAGGGGAVLAVDDPGKAAFMFGGTTPAVGVTNTTWEVNQTSAAWTLLKTPVAPSLRTDFSYASGGSCGAAILFGGQVNPTTRQDTNDTWLFNFSTRSWKNVSGTVGPAPRQGGALAVDSASCTAILFGGANQDYRSGNSTGSVQWNDTWQFAFATHRWSPVVTNGTPPSLSDAGFLYDNLSRYFLLYGGCEALCSGVIWQYDPGNASWILRPSAPSAPPPRGGADWSFGSLDEIAVLSSGYVREGNVVTALNDTYVYQIGNNRWDTVEQPTPGPRYAAAGGWLSANGCPGFVLVGGAGAPTDPPDQWFLDQAPDIPLACNTWGNDSISVSGGGQGHCDYGFYVVVNVTNALNGSPVAGANVTVAGNCSRASSLTNVLGQAVFAIGFAPYAISVTAPLFHTNRTFYQPAPLPVIGYQNISLTPLPRLVVHSFDRGAFGPALPLGNVTVRDENGIVLGATDLNGTFVLDPYWPLGLYETFSGNRSGYGDAKNVSPIPFTGNWTVNLTLLAPGPVDVLVLEAGTAVPLSGAFVTVFAAPGNPPGGFQLKTNAAGWANGTVIGDNLTATATLATFSLVSTKAPFYHPWAAVTVVVLNMTSNSGYTVDAEVLNGVTRAPLAGANVQVGNYPPEPVNRAGWANLSGIRPAGTYGVIAWRTNFTTNQTHVELSYQKPVWIVVFDLYPLKGCNGTAALCNGTRGNGQALAPLSLFPEGSPGWAVLLLSGGLLFALPATALIFARRRGGSGRGPGGAT